MHGTHLRSRKALVTLNNIRVLIVRVESLGLNANLASMLVIIVDKEVTKIKTSFLIIPNTSLSNGFICYSYNT